MGSAFLPAYNIFHVPLSSSLISLTPPLSPPLQGRGNSAYCIFLTPIQFVGLHIVPQQKRKAEPAFPIISFMSLCLFVQNLYVFLSKNLYVFLSKTFMSFCLKTLCLYVQSPKVQKVRRAPRRAYRRRVGTLNSVMRDVTCSLPCMARTRNVALPSFSRLPACTVAV